MCGQNKREIWITKLVKINQKKYYAMESNIQKLRISMFYYH